MKKILTLLVLFLASFVCADVQPTIEQDGEYRICEECESFTQFPGVYLEDYLCGNYEQWKRFKTFIDPEEISARFPEKPTVIYVDLMVEAGASQNGIQYVFSGFYPPNPGLDDKVWFDELLTWARTPPLQLLCSKIYRASNGDYMMDYNVRDQSANVIIKARAICTPFNKYCLRCFKPADAIDSFDYFVDNFQISIVP